MGPERVPSRSRLAALNEVVPPATRALTTVIRHAHGRAGSPSFRALSDRNTRAGRGVLAKATLSRIFSPNPRSAEGLPEWTYYAELLQVLGADPAEHHAGWESARTEWATRAPGPARPAEPVPRWRNRRWWLVAGALALLAAGGIAVAVTLVAGALALLAAGGIAVAVTLAAGHSPAGPQPAARPDPGMDNTNPSVTGCTPELGEQVYYSHLYDDWPTNTRMTTAQIALHYSVKCRTVWAVLTDAPPGTQATLHREGDNTELHCTAAADGSCLTSQLSDIGVSTHALARTPDSYGQTRSR